MLLFYVDESGSTGMPTTDRRSHYDLFSLAAVGIMDSSRSALAQDMEGLKQQTFRDAYHPDEWNATEIKARYLWMVHEAINGKRPHPELPAPYALLIDRQEFNHLLFRIEKVFAKFRPTVFAAIVDKRALDADQPGASVLGAAYASLYQSVALTMENVYGGASAAFVADQQDEHERYFASGAMREVLAARPARGKYRPDYNLLLDKPLWIDSRLSTWDREIIQLADLAAFATRAWASAGRPPEDRHFLWSAISPFLASDWRTGTGVRGAGLTIIPEPTHFPEL